MALLVFAGLVVSLGLAAAVYWPGLSGPFMLDDGPNIAAVHIANPDWEAIVYTITHNGSGLMGRGLSMLSFVLTGLQFGLDPWGYKYHNLLLHLLNGLLLFRFLQVLVPLLDRKLDERRSLLIAGATAALWLLHPLMVSTVLYAVQRMTQLAVLFSLLALLAYLNARTEITRTFKFYLFGWFIFPLMALLAVLSKETAVLIPLYLLVIEVLAFRTGPKELKESPRLAVLTGVFIVLPLVIAAVALAWKFDALINYGTRTFTLYERVLTQAHAIAFYVRLILLPRLRDMSLFHDDFPVTVGLDAVTLLLLALLVVVPIAAWRMRDTWPVVAFAPAWFIVSHLLESTIVPLEMVFEHRNYFATMPLLLLPVWIVLRAPLKPLWFLLPLTAAMYAFMTATRAAEWGDYDLFHRIAVEEHPGSPRALNGYVNYLMETRAFGEAEKKLEQLQQLTPAEAGVPLHRQVLGCMTGQHHAAALADARHLLASYPASVYAHNGLQTLVMLVVDNKCAVVPLDDVAKLVDAALEFETADARGRGYLMRLRGIVALASGRYAQGYSDFREAHEATGDVSLLTDLLRYQTQYGRLGDAEETLVLIESENAARLGVEQYQVDKARALLVAAREPQTGNQNAIPAETTPDL
jgi:hypothetical protein